MLGRTEEKSWLEEELERERKGICVGETWWEKIKRFMEGAYEIFVGPLRRRIDAVIMERTAKKIEFKYSSGLLTMNQARALYDLPPVIDSDEELILYADNQAVVRQNALNAARALAKCGISAEEMTSRINQCIL